MKPVLLIDFGSTYTKLVAVDLDQAELLGTASALTTADKDIGDGFQKALADLHTRTGVLDYGYKLACSSAAGGLRMMVSGLVPELTAEAARLAALGAGARIIRVFSHELSRRDLEEIEAAVPDIFLLTGGTDGGNQDCVTGNAKKLASLPLTFPIIYAGNRNALDACEVLLKDFPLTVCPNVMPRFGELRIEPVQEEIRALFLSRIVQARGLTRTKELLSGILMPTPSALLAAVTLLADGTGDEPGLGELMAIDVGGATTDVYSIGRGEPDDIRVIVKGLEEPYAKRTVEGDIGVRHSIPGILEEAGLEEIARDAGLSVPETEDLLDQITQDCARLPQGGQDRLRRLDDALAAEAIEAATRRHAGQVEEVYTPTGLAYVQTGKNLKGIRQLILTGGCLVHTARPRLLARRALYSRQRPESLRPLEVELYLDRSYILATLGVLAEREPALALRIMKKELTRLGSCRRE